MIMNFEQISESDDEIIFKWKLKLIDQSQRKSDMIAYQCGKIYFLMMLSWALEKEREVKIGECYDIIRDREIRITPHDIEKWKQGNPELLSDKHSRFIKTKEERGFSDTIKSQFKQKLKLGKTFEEAADEIWHRS